MRKVTHAVGCESGLRLGKARCTGCATIYQRIWRRAKRRADPDYFSAYRKANPLVGEARRKAIVRSIAGVAKRRGQLVQKPCQDCGSPSSEMHHPDYNKPLAVEWLCRQCHLERH